ncbi:hypothetical protein SAMN05216559_4153 [Halomicrobium zhouii]|uniref:Zinc carboxypeptidase n=1 Tax=Halomicrobium zhouii TaxID=767519 RepID=A0A1I6MAZ2_9EURY|nr:hypothetical protein [Halomicrobium zhouii]SFS12896.1 hypothetical protein SAMN05216559_4153 [Halomicrobium zhouii]
MDEDGTVAAADAGLRVLLGYPGANATDLTVDGDTVNLAPDLRDAGDDWLFYWNVSIESDENRIVTVSFPEKVVGPWGPAVSQDCAQWSWLGADATVDRTAFRYEFGPGERTFFAFSLPYVRQDFERFWSAVDSQGQIERSTLTTTERGRTVPVLRIGDPGSDTHAVITCRHHACESPASLVLEGILSKLADRPPKSWCAHVVPFVDLDGVQRGDQGKQRLPHDHNRDYAESNGVTDEIDPLYSTTSAIKRYVRSLGGTIPLGLDLHSPFKWGSPHDRVFFAGAPAGATDADRRFARVLDDESDDRANSLCFRVAGGFAEPGGRGGGTTFTGFLDRQGATVSRALEVPYFGTQENQTTPERCWGLGSAVGQAVERFIDDETND